MEDTTFGGNGAADNFELRSRNFLAWLQRNGATLSPKITLKDYRSENAGRGVQAVEDIEENEVLFSIPGKLILSAKTTKIADFLNGLRKSRDQNSDDADLAETALRGWDLLILSLMYERMVPGSFWAEYFDVLPNKFSTPMFWSDEEMELLKGTGIPSRLGKEEATEGYNKRLKPIVEESTSPFSADVHTVETYHIAASTIMAYAFHDEEKDNQAEGTEMDDEEIREEEEVSIDDHVMMIPMADMLNHRTGHNNARLFHEPDCVKMLAIKRISKGQQIYNTYGQLPSSDLLRKYGFVDVENPYDIVEIPGPYVVDAVNEKDSKFKEKKMDLLLEEGALDEYFVIDREDQELDDQGSNSLDDWSVHLPEEMIICLRVLMMNRVSFKTLTKSMDFPSPELTGEVYPILKSILGRRLSEYPSTIEADEAHLEDKEVSVICRNAILVRLSEVRLLKKALHGIEQWKLSSSTKARDGPQEENSPAKRKRT